MRTHELSDLLFALAKALRDGPDRTFEELSSGGSTREKPDSRDIPVALTTLLALSDVDKNQWRDFIKANKFPIVVRPRDASRDILGKLLRYLEQNPEARERLTSNATKSRSETSPELMRALEAILRS